MSEQVDETNETPQGDVFATVLATLQDLQDSIISIHPHWELERLYRVSQQGDLIDAASEEEDNTAWMSCSGAKTDRDEMLRVLDFLQKKNPTDKMRLVRVETVRVVEVVEDAPEDEK